MPSRKKKGKGRKKAKPKPKHTGDDRANDDGGIRPQQPTKEEGADRDGGDGAADLKEEHTFWLPPLLNGEYNVILPGEQISLFSLVNFKLHKEGVYKLNSQFH